MAQTQKTELSPRNVQMAIMVAAGVGTREIAKQFDMTEQNVCKIKRSELFNLEVKRYMANLPDMSQILQSRLNSVTELGLDVLEDLMKIDAKEDITLKKLQSSHAQRLLEKAGFGSTSNVNLNQRVAQGNVLSPEEAELLNAQAAEIRGHTKS